MFEDLVTREAFIQQVYDVEGIKINLTSRDGNNYMVRPYNFSKLPDDATVNDLMLRIDYCVNTPLVSMCIKL